MRAFLFLFFIVLFPLHFSAQSLCKKFHRLSKPEKHWVLLHPVKAKKSFRITAEVQKVVDSIKQSGSIGTDNNGGKLDAFKHTFWMACLATKIGSKQARKLGIAHEKGNYLQFLKHQLEDSFLPDSVSTVMDLRNNENGIDIHEKFKKISTVEIQNKTLAALQQGKLSMIKKDKEGNVLFCNGAAIPMNEWKGKWNIPKCLIVSNE